MSVSTQGVTQDVADKIRVYVDGMIRPFINHPGDLFVTARTTSKKVDIKVRANPADVGLIIGKHHATFQALKYIATTLAFKHNVGLFFKVLQPEDCHVVVGTENPDEVDFLGFFDWELAALSPDDLIRLPDSFAAIRVAVAEVCAVSLKDLCGTRGRQEVANARMIAMYIAHKWRLGTTTKVGECFGRHYTSVVHARRTVSEYVVSGDNVKVFVERALQKLARMVKALPK